MIIALCSLVFSAYSQSLDEQIRRVHNNYLEDYSLSSDHDVTYGKLDDDDYTYYTFTLKSYWTYRITAVCDGDCSDIDLVLYDENDNMIDDDLETDDYPIVGCKPSWTGKFKLKVKMVNCRVNPCGFKIAIFRK